MTRLTTPTARDVPPALEKRGCRWPSISRKEKGKVNQLARGLDVEFTSVEVPNSDRIVEERLRGWARGLADQQDEVKAPEGLLEEVDLLLGPLSKEDIIARLVSRELARLNLSNRKDLNEKGGGKDDDGYQRQERLQERAASRRAAIRKTSRAVTRRAASRRTSKRAATKKTTPKEARLQTAVSTAASTVVDFLTEKPVLTVSVPRVGGSKKEEPARAASKNPADPGALASPESASTDHFLTG